MLSDAAFAQTPARLRHHGALIGADPADRRRSSFPTPGRIPDGRTLGPVAESGPRRPRRGERPVDGVRGAGSRQGDCGTGVQGLIVGAAGWAGIAIGQGHLREALNNTSGTTRRVADVMVATAQDSMHQWLNVTLIVGGGLVIVGVIVSLLTGLARTS